MKAKFFNTYSALALSLVVSACACAWVVKDGTSKGNGCCYDDKTGKYCGKAVDDHGQTLPSNKPCECGIYLSYQPSELDTLEVFTTTGATLEGGTAGSQGPIVVLPYVRGVLAKPIKLEGGKFTLPEGCTGVIASGFKVEAGVDPSNPQFCPLKFQIRGEPQSVAITASASKLEPKAALFKDGDKTLLVITGGVAPFRITTTVGRRRGASISTMQREFTLPNARFDRVDVLDRNLRRVVASD